MEIITLDEMIALKTAAAIDQVGMANAYVPGWQQLQLAKEIIRRGVGIKIGKGVPRTAGDYLAAREDDPIGGMRVIDRTIELADAIYLLRDVPHFEQKLAAMRGRPWAALAVELRVAAALHRAGHAIRFVPESGERGRDYDLVVQLGGVDVFIEAKSKEDLPYERKRLENALRDAAKQLPESGPGVIVIDIPQSWFEDPVLDRELGKLVADVLRQRRRVNRIQLIGKRVVIVPGVGVRVEHWKWAQDNPNPRAPVAHLDHLIKPIVVPAVVPGGASRVLASFWDAIERDEKA